jgi:two-component system nitrogen regulation response regulator GlnG
MAPAQVIEAKDLPPEVRGQGEPMPFERTLSPEAMEAPTRRPSAPDTAPASPSETKALSPVVTDGWLVEAGADARRRLEAGEAGVWDTLTRELEAQLIRSALAATGGRRNEAARRLGNGRNTITRKIQELGLDD